MPAPLVPPGDIGPGGRPRPGTVGTLVADLPNDERIELTRAGPRITRTFLVKDLRGDVDHRLHNALFVSGVPQMGEIHKAVEGAFVGRVGAEHLPGSPTQARVHVEWGFFADEEDDPFFNEPDDNAVPVLEIASTMVRKTTNFDVHGAPILLEYTRDVPLPGEEGPSGPELPPQVAAVEYQVSEDYVLFRRRERNDPWARSRLYKGTVNATPVFGWGPRYWMCVQLDGFTDDRGASWNVTYAFQRNVDTWDARSIYRDPATGEGVPDPIEGVGIKTVELYPATNFFDLNLTLATP